MAYCLAQPFLRCVLYQPVASQVYLFRHASAASTLMLLIKVSAAVTVYGGHRHTLFSCWDYLSVHHVHRNY